MNARTGMSMVVMIGLLALFIPCFAESPDTQPNVSPCINCSLKSGEKSMINAVLLSTGPGLRAVESIGEDGAVFFCSDGSDENGGGFDWGYPEDIGFDPGAWDTGYNDPWDQPDNYGGYSDPWSDPYNTGSTSVGGIDDTGSGIITGDPQPPTNGCIGTYCDCTNYASLCPGTYYYDSAGNRRVTLGAQGQYKASCCGGFEWNPIYVQ